MMGASGGFVILPKFLRSLKGKAVEVWLASVPGDEGVLKGDLVNYDASFLLLEDEEGEVAVNLSQVVLVRADKRREAAFAISAAKEYAIEN